MLLTGFFIQLGIANQSSLLKILIGATFANGYISFIFLDCFADYFKYKKEYEKLSEEEYNGLKKNEEEFKELVQQLEAEISNIEVAIIKFEKELDNISILEENQKANFMNNPFYLADTKEEYDLLTNREYEQAWNEFFNEKIDCSKVHLEVKEVESENVKALIKKV